MTAFGAMTWNVENLFRPPQDATDEEREHYRKKLGLLAGAGRRDSPDVALGRGRHATRKGQRAGGGEGGVPLLVLGDLNDVPEAQTSLLLTCPPGSEIGTLGFGRPDVGDDARLFNLAPLIPQERRFSRVERGRRELLDQILASVECFPAGEDGDRRLPEADSHVYFRERFPSVTDDPAEREDDVAPDHAPVIARFEL